MDVGDKLIYRLRDFSQSEHVPVVSIDTRKKTPRYDVEFLDGQSQGTVENVPGGRLRGPWSTVRECDERMAHWERFTKQAMGRYEEDAVERVFTLLVPDGAAALDWHHSVWSTRILDAGALGTVIGIQVSKRLESVDSYVVEEETVVSPEGTMRIAEYACRVNPMPVLDAVIEDEKQYREYSKRGRPRGTYDSWGRRAGVRS